ncbi:hypothetical protein RDWZM_002928 [Blomia tropicalis]|uniref:Exoribonuclease phosphorolytic domain-containing protein n=1 Tax=Blomia tropicalis TaxID=40697 RepID=A0A9Q0MFV5_BLOTA|nr:hypothetical protein RDWZM_002928 [Blomia tropicalis]
MKFETDFLNTKNENMEIDSDKSTDQLGLVSNLNRCSGSAMYTFGDNIIQCSIFGPNPVSTNMNLLKKNYFNVYLYPLGKISNQLKDKSLKYYEHFFKRTFSFVVFQALLPRSRTYMVLNEIEKGSSFITSSFNAASMALIDSGYSLNYCIGSCGIILDQDGTMYTEKEYKNKFNKLIRTYEPINVNFETPDTTIKATFCSVIRNTTLKPVSFVAEGKFSLNNVFEAQQKSVDPVISFFDYLKTFVHKRFV